MTQAEAETRCKGSFGPSGPLSSHPAGTDDGRQHDRPAVTMVRVIFAGLVQVRAKSAMLAAVWAAMSGSTAANTSMPCDVPITTRHCALTPAPSKSR
jgi:hypothetical protein